MPTQLPVNGKHEQNPFRPDLPDSINEISPQLFEHMREVIETLRETHNWNQAGDSTFSWELLTKVDVQKQYKLGSQGRFYHPEYGIIRARYVQFVDMVASSWTGSPVGLRVNGALRGWRVTNDISKSHTDLVIGLPGCYVAPPNESFGWVVTHGPNLQSVSIRKRTPLKLFDKTTWPATGSLGVLNDGRVMGTILATDTVAELTAESDDEGYALEPDPAKIFRRWEVPAGSVWVEAQADSEQRIRDWILEYTGPIVTRLLKIESQLITLSGSMGIAGITARIGAAEKAIDRHATLIATESEQRTFAFNGLLDRVTILERLNRGGGVTGSSFVALQNQVNANYDEFTTLKSLASGQLTRLTDNVNLLLSFKGTVESQIQGASDGLAALSSRITKLTFAQLFDTPDDYTGHALEGFWVNSGGTGLEFHKFLELPTGGASNQILRKFAATDGAAAWINLTAGIVAFTPIGGVAATDVQAAIAELDAEKIKRTSSSIDNAIVRWDGTGGVEIQSSGLTVDDSDQLNGRRAILTETTAGARVLRLEYKPKIGTSDNAFEISNGTINTLEIKMNQTSSEGHLTLRAPSSQGSGAAINLQSNVGGTTREFNFQLDNGGNAVMRQSSGQMFFDFFSGANWRDSSFNYIFSLDSGSATLYRPLTVPDGVYNSSSWDGNLTVPTKNAIRDIIETKQDLLLTPIAQIPTLLSPWINYAGGYLGARYFKTKENVVVLEGLIQAPGGTSTASVTIFTLLTGYRPSADLIFVGWCGGGAYRINVRSNGDVILENCNTALTSLSGISFVVA